MTKGGFSVCHRKKHFILPPQFITQVGSYILGIHIQQSPAMQWYRYKRLMGFDVFYLTGVDEHGKN